MRHALHILRHIAIFSLLCLALGCAPLTQTDGGRDTNVVGPRKVIALVPDAQTTSDMRTAGNAEGYQLLDVSDLSGLDLTMLTFKMPAGVTGPQAIAALEAAVPGSTVGINHAYRLQQSGSVA